MIKERREAAKEYQRREVVRGIKGNPDGACLTFDAGLSASLNLRCRIQGTVLNLPPEK